MLAVKPVDFHGIECMELENDRLSVLATVSVGPRLLSFKGKGDESPFAYLPGITLDCPGEGAFHFVGGHRLWHAPEDSSTTYLPDNAPVTWEAVDGGLRLVQAVEARTSLQKELFVRLIDNRAAAEIRHRITNQGDSPRQLAPWAITQLRPGGVALLPQPGHAPHGNPTWPNRTLALWPYTDIRSDHIDWGNETIIVHANLTDGKLKLGFPNPVGWLAYWWNGILFVKRAPFEPNDEYLDRGSSSQCYCDPDFLELETLGPVARLEPGASLEHVETWSLYEGVAWDEGPNQALDLILRG